MKRTQIDEDTVQDQLYAWEENPEDFLHDLSHKDMMEFISNTLSLLTLEGSRRDVGIMDMKMLLWCYAERRCTELMEG